MRSKYQRKKLRPKSKVVKFIIFCNATWSFAVSISFSHLFFFYSGNFKVLMKEILSYQKLNARRMSGCIGMIFSSGLYIFV
jgi:hypothetical protein